MEGFQSYITASLQGSIADCYFRFSTHHRAKSSKGWVQNSITFFVEVKSIGSKSLNLRKKVGVKFNDQFL